MKVHMFYLLITCLALLFLLFTPGQFTYSNQFRKWFFDCSFISWSCWVPVPGNIKGSYWFLGLGKVVAEVHAEKIGENSESETMVFPTSITYLRILGFDFELGYMEIPNE